MSSKTTRTIKKKTPTPAEPKAEVPPKKIRTFELRLSSDELIHFRDLMSVLLPPDGTTTLSQSLANSEGRQMLEAKLWAKLTDLCKQAGVPTDDEAPDYAVGIVGVPTLGVYPIQLGEDEEEEK